MNELRSDEWDEASFSQVCVDQFVFNTFSFTRKDSEDHFHVILVSVEKGI